VKVIIRTGIRTDEADEIVLALRDDADFRRGTVCWKWGPGLGVNFVLNARGSREILSSGACWVLFACGNRKRRYTCMRPDLDAVSRMVPLFTEVYSLFGNFAYWCSGCNFEFARVFSS
jgi:hypothetical protein